MKDLKKVIIAFIIVICLGLSAKVHGQPREFMDSYNTALVYYNQGNYSSAISELKRFMSPMEENPSAWVKGPGDITLIYKVYRLAAGCYYNSGDSGSADIVVENLIYVLEDYYYESDIINRYNSTDISGYR